MRATHTLSRTRVPPAHTLEIIRTRFCFFLFLFSLFLAVLTAEERQQDSTAKLRKYTELLLSLLRLVPNPTPTAQARLTSGAASPRPALVWLGLSARGAGAPVGTAGSRKFDAIPAWRPVLEQHGVALVRERCAVLCCDVLCFDGRAPPFAVLQLLRRRLLRSVLRCRLLCC